MTQVTNWFEQKFEFYFPTELCPNRSVRLRGAPVRREEIVRGCPHELLVRRPQEDKWSAQEHAGHLLDVESMWMSRVDDYLAGRSELTPADLSNRKTHNANHHARRLADILADFRQARLRLVERVEESQPEMFARSLLHPRPMRLVDHLYFAAEHDDHHLARIWELINEH